MSTFDEEMMRRALQEAADDFVIAEGAVDRILDEARDSASVDGSSSIRAFVQRNGRVRSSLMAAAACIVVLAVAVPLFNSEVHPKVPIAVTVIRGTGQSATHGLTGALLPAGESALLPPGQNKDIQGTGFTAGAPTLSFTTPVASQTSKNAKSSDAATVQSSLRVEEVGSIQLSVANDRFQPTLTQLTEFATTDGGFVASTQSHIGTKANHTYSSGSVVLSVPEHNFTMLVDQVRHSGDATSVETSATDVTGQYVDLQARINALEVSRTQYLKIMSRTNSIGGILSVQEQLNSIQSQIEQLQAQLNLLNSETTYATLTVYVSVAGHHVIMHVHAPKGVDKAWHQSLHGFAAGVEWLIRIAGPLLFALLLLAALLLLGRWTWRATERRRSGIS